MIEFFSASLSCNVIAKGSSFVMHTYVLSGLKCEALKEPENCFFHLGSFYTLVHVVCEFCMVWDSQDSRRWRVHHRCMTLEVAFPLYLFTVNTLMFDVQSISEWLTEMANGWMSNCCLPLPHGYCPVLLCHHTICHVIVKCYPTGINWVLSGQILYTQIGRHLIVLDPN